MWKTIRMYALAVKCYIRGESWEDSLWYAERIVKGWGAKWQG